MLSRSKNDTNHKYDVLLLYRCCYHSSFKYYFRTLFHSNQDLNSEGLSEIKLYFYIYDKLMSKDPIAMDKGRVSEVD